MLLKCSVAFFFARYLKERNLKPVLTITSTTSDIVRKKCDGTQKPFWHAKDSGHEPAIKLAIADRVAAY